MLLTGVSLESLGIGVDLMQLHAVGFAFQTIVVTVKANGGRYDGIFFDIILVAGIVATGFVGNELRMIDRDESSLNNLVRHLVTALTAGLHEPAVTCATLEEMAGEANFLVYAEVLFSLDVAMTQTAGDFYAVDHVFDVNLVGKFHAAVNEVFRFKFFGTVALRSHTGGVVNRSVRLCADPADHTGHGLSQAVYLALDVACESGLQMTVKTIHVRMTRIVPTLVKGIHDVAGIAEARLSGDNDCSAAEENHNCDQQRYPDGPFHLPDNVYR
jgi:hypothetical protein